MKFSNETGTKKAIRVNGGFVIVPANSTAEVGIPLTEAYIKRLKTLGVVEVKPPAPKKVKLKAKAKNEKPVVSDVVIQDET